jgi:hypothetical protein
VSTIDTFLLSALPWALPFLACVHLSRLLRLSDERAFQLFVWSLIVMLFWLILWISVGVHWIYNHLCY